ncbi:hypothetical protein IWC96_12040 [Brevundimonas sp. BAL450]|uniref:hypothetical protein n=1 Tax=Brevundimonas TaxID=41275 RepID=UPI0018CBD2CC|nr:MULTISPECIES: hypothetical protein [Brevundimonas]MBG7615999.1 hypothetical protein [Brevundimonas sp. BAL450]
MADARSYPHAFALTRLLITIAIGVWPFFFLPAIHPRADLDSWVPVAVIVLVAALVGLWLLRFVLRRIRARRRLSDSPLHRLHGWVESVDEVDFLEPPGVEDYPLWRGTVVDRLMRLIGRPLGARGEDRISDAFLPFVLLAFAILATATFAPAFAETTWNAAFAVTGVTLWSAIPVLGGVFAALQLRQWAARTLRQIERPEPEPIPRPPVQFP